MSDQMPGPQEELEARNGAPHPAEKGFTQSAEGTSITTVGPVITDAAGNTYGISANAYVLTNGAEERTISANVVRLYYHAPAAGAARQLYQQNRLGNWYTRTSITATYAGPVTSPTASSTTTAPPATSVPKLTAAGPLHGSDTIMVTRDGLAVAVPLTVVAAYIASAIAAAKPGHG